MATLPHPDKTWRQYGEAIHHYTQAQMIEYGRQCAAESYDQTALELCTACGWKTMTPGDCYLNCERDARRKGDATMPVTGYLRATPEGVPIWGEDCVCEDAVYPTFDEYSGENGSGDDASVSMPIVRQVDAKAALDAKDTEIAQLQDLHASADRTMAEQEAEIAALKESGPLMERGSDGDGKPIMGTMKQILQDYRSAANYEAGEVDRLNAEIAALKADRDSWYQQNQQHIDDAIGFSNERDVALVEIAALTKQNNAYKALTESMDKRTATHEAARARWEEAINTLASERQANALLTGEIAALRKDGLLVAAVALGMVGRDYSSELPEDAQQLAAWVEDHVLPSMSNTFSPAEAIASVIRTAMAQAVQHG